MDALKLPLGETYRTAYEIFSEELRTSLAMLEAVSRKLVETAPDQCREALSEEAAQLKQRFHLLKGGAGFLKLERIADAAGKGELLFRDSTADGATRARQQLQTLVVTLGEEASSLEEALAMLVEG